METNTQEHNETAKPWTSQEFAEFMSWSPRALKHRIDAGSELPASIQVGTQYFFRPETVYTWLESLEAADANKAVH